MTSRKLSIEQAEELLQDLYTLLSDPYPFTPAIVRNFTHVSEEVNAAKQSLNMLQHAYLIKEQSGEYKVFKTNGKEVVEGKPNQEEEKEGWRMCNKVADENVSMWLKQQTEFNKLELYIEELGVDFTLNISTVKPEHVKLIMKHRLDGNNA